MPAKEEPVRVKIYGVFSKTKSSYLAQQSLAVVLTAVLLLVWFNAPDPGAPPGRSTAAHLELESAAQRPRLPPEVEMMMQAMNAIPWIVGVMLALIGLETFFVMRAFARKEAEVKAKAAAASPASAGDPDSETRPPADAESPV